MRRWVWACWLLLFSCSALANTFAPALPQQHGDLDALLKHRVLRALVVYERGFFFLDHGQQKGILVNQLKGLERWLNRTYLPHAKNPLHIVTIPVRRDRLLDYLAQGYGDLVVANLTVTPARAEKLRFTKPHLQSDIYAITTQSNRNRERSRVSSSCHACWSLSSTSINSRS